MSSIDTVTNSITALNNSADSSRLAGSERSVSGVVSDAPGLSAQSVSSSGQAGVRPAEKMDVERQVTEVAPDAEELSEALAEIQDKLKPGSRSLQFSVNETLNDVVVRVVDPANDQIIREIPPEAIINMRERLREMNTDEVSPADLFPAGALLSDQS